MRASIITSVMAFAAIQVAAQDSYWSQQSAPFNLVLHSDDASLNGSFLSTCHEGAAIEGFCIASPVQTSNTAFTFNQSVGAAPTDAGILTWTLNTGSLVVPSTMQFSYDSASNVAIPIVYPGNDEYQEVIFAADGTLGVPSSQDDTQPLPNYNPVSLARWYACTTYYAYLYQTLAWSLGAAPPQNPTCVAVAVVRTFI